MKKRITASLLIFVLCLSILPFRALASSDWVGWEDWENIANEYATYPDSGKRQYNWPHIYACPKIDASYTEVEQYVAKLMAEYQQTANETATWSSRTLVFKYSSSEKQDAMRNNSNFCIGANINTSDSIGRILCTGSGFIYQFRFVGGFQDEYVLKFDTDAKNDIDYSLTRQKLLEIVHAAKAYSSTPSGQLEYVNQYLIDHIKYSKGGITDGGSTYEAIVQGTAVCAGYTSAVQDICFLLGIPSIELYGYDPNTGIRHVWNCVYIDGQWKMLDVTWNDTTGRNKAYFLVDSINDDMHDISKYDNPKEIELAKAFALRIHELANTTSNNSPSVPTTPTTPSVSQPSSWAIAQVNAAIEAKLVPQNLQSGYNQPTTRAEFCALAVALYENLKGEITGRTSFTDTNDVNVQKAAFINVVGGVGNNRFDPNAQLTREQAAAMLARLADAVGKPFPKQEATFADNSVISSWAVDVVGQVQAAGIMGGVGDNRFAPQDPYTREQSIVTIMRLFDILK